MFAIKFSPDGSTVRVLTESSTEVVKHKGTIGLTSEPGKGSLFWFTLPNDRDDDE